MTVTLISQDGMLQHMRIINHLHRCASSLDLWHLEVADFFAVALQHLPILVSEAFSPFLVQPNVCLENLFLRTGGEKGYLIWSPVLHHISKKSALLLVFSQVFLPQEMTLIEYWNVSHFHDHYLMQYLKFPTVLFYCLYCLPSLQPKLSVFSTHETPQFRRFSFQIDILLSPNAMSFSLKVGQVAA